MAKVYLDDTTLTGIANQTRRLKQNQETYKPSEMVTALSTVPIPSVPTGTINITQNGTTDVTDYATANVNVPTPAPNLQNKSVTITTNTTTTVQKDTGYDGLGTVEVTTNVQPNLQSKSITITENGTQTVTPDTGKDGLSSVEITTNVSGGGGTEENDVNFYDYDGTLLHSYTKSAFLALTEMPENPTHTGLVAQGWNWDLTDAKAHVTDYDELDIGQVYTTASGLSEFDIELNAKTGLTINLMMDGTKNWGDGTSDTTTSHTYANAGKYTISCNGTTKTTSSSSGLFGQSSSTYNQFLIFARLENLTGDGKQIFHHCRSLKYVTVSKDVTVNNSSFNYCDNLEFIVLKKFNFGSNMFESSRNLKKISVSKATSGGTRTFNNCYSLKVPISLITTGSEYMMAGCMSAQNQILKINGAVTSIKQYAYSDMGIPMIFDFTKNTAIPTLASTSAFGSLASLTKIIVPDSLYSTWISASNWTTYADYIIKESDYNAS